jgi:DNA-binding SARP family transcriptional activator/tetratricopeptide (TPR) repeat protein
MEFAILGPLECRDGNRVVPLRGAKQRALLAILLLQANEVVSSDRLLDDLWGTEPPSTGATALQVRISQLRKALGERGRNLVTQSPGYVLQLERDEFDLFRFEQLVAEAEGAEPRAASSKLREALTLWRGPALSDLSYETFAQAPIARLEELRLAVLERRIDADLELGRHAGLVGELEQLAADHPLREGFRARLMLALYRSGRQAEALNTYAATRRALVEELGIEPSPALQELERRILRQDSALDAPSDLHAEPSRDAEFVIEPSSAPAIREERKVVSVLLAAVGSASDLLADPEDMQLALGPFYSMAKREIERHGGTFEKLLGESVLAVFGSPIAHEDDPERAVRVALAIRGWALAEGVDLQIRLAVNTGVALVTVDERLQPSPTIVTGEVITIAQRLHRAAPVGGILVGPQTYRATREAIEYREVASVETSERSGPIATWEAVEAGEVSGVDLLREPTTPLVGRTRELDLLGSTLARVCEERSAQLVTLVGVPGIGKSRLAFELFKALGQDRELVTWLQGRCLPYGDGVSFWALGEVVKAQAGILESDSPAQAEEKLQLAVAEAVPEAQEVPWVEQHLRPLLGVSGELGPRERSEDAFPAWRRFLAGLADLRPLILVLEDLHWADKGLLTFIDELVDHIRDAPLLLLCTTRPELLERVPGWGGGKANALTISLPPLSNEETGRIFAALLDESRLEDEMRAGLLIRAAGNPLYAEQFARMLAELGSLEELPETVQGIIAARLDGLLSNEKALLHDAAVVGKVFWPGALEAIGDRSGEEVRAALVSLERKEFVQQARRSAVGGESEYAFRHILLRDVAYGQIARASRAQKHRRAAAWIESLGRPDDHAEMLAHHYLRALEYAKAAGEADPALTEKARLSLRTAGDRALALASYASAARSYTTALELWPEDDPQRVWVLVDAGRARAAADGTGIDLLEQGFDELRSGGEANGAAEVAVDIARCHWLAGDRDRAYRYVDQALELASSVVGSRARAHALVARAAYHMLASEHREAINLAREALPLTEALGIDRLRVRALDVLGASRTLLGEVDGLDDSRRAVALARRSNSYSQLVTAEGNLYMNQFSLGHLSGASEVLGSWLRDAESYGTAMEGRWARVADAYEAVFHGRWDAASSIVDQLIAEADAGMAHYLDPACRALRASIHFARGHLEEAATDSDKALEGARRTKDPQSLAPVLALRGIVLLAQGQREEASRLASEVLTLGSAPPSALRELFPAATPIEFAWLLCDLGRETELLSALDSAPSTPWLEAARAIADKQFTHSVELVSRIGALSVEAYTRLRVAEELTRAGREEEAQDLLVPALAFFKKVNATRFFVQAKQVLVASRAT